MMDPSPSAFTDRPSVTENANQTPVGTETPTISNPRRRRALRCLGGFAYPVELHTLAAYIVAARANIPVEAVGTDTCRRTAIEFYHLDLPALTTADLVAYDSESRMLVRTATDSTDRYTESSADTRQFDGS